MSYLGGFEGPLSEDDLDDADYALAEENPANDPLINQIKSEFKKKKAKKRKIKKHSVESNPPEELEVNFPLEVAETDTDSDKLFLLSFLPEMRQLPVNVKMWVRAQIANIMQEAVTCQYNNTTPGVSSDRNNLDIKRLSQDGSD